MKKKIPVLALMALSAAAYADTTEWSGEGGSQMMIDGQWADSRWTNGTPDASKDVIIRHNWTRLLGGASVIEMKSLTFATGFGFLTLSGDDEGKVRDGTFDKSSYTAPTLKIGSGGISYSGSVTTDEVTFGSPDYRYGFNNISVDGDITFNALSVMAFGWNPNATYGTDNWSLDVGGIVNMNGGRVDQRLNINRCGGANQGPDPVGTVDAYVRFGGLDGSGVICNNDHGAVSTNIYFQAQEGKTFQGGDWSGTISKWYLSDTSVAMNLVMDGGANGGKQYLRLGIMSGNQYDERPNSFNLNVLSGHIGINNDNASRFDKIELNGGTLEVAYIRAGTHDPSQDEMGFIYADKLEINAASQIIFDVSGGASSMYENDVMHVGDISGSGVVTLVIELDANYFAEGQEINDSYQIFSLTGANNYDWAQALVKVMYKGGDISDQFSWLARYSGDGTGGSVWVDLVGVVPEPAAVAAILGAAALAFAVWRKRK